MKICNIIGVRPQFIKKATISRVVKNHDDLEEINRIAADAISNIFFAPTQTAMDHLKNEGLSNRAVFSGDVMYDSVLYYKDKLEQQENKDIHKNFYLATIHRPANTDNINSFESIMKAFATFDKKIIFPAHPRIKKLLKTVQIPNNVTIIEPVGYLEILSLIIAADLVFTDSGGLQKECFFLKKRCVTLRTETEWEETLENNCNCLVGGNKSKIANAEKSDCGEFRIEDKFGNGRASNKNLNKSCDILEMNQ